jgi:hypothetical protein
MRSVTYLLITIVSLAREAIGDYTSYCRSSTGTTTSGTGSCLGGNIFLKGQFIEVGIHNAGSFGTGTTCPAGFTCWGNPLGFIADYDKNGFAAGSPSYAGDYFVPGTPLEGK